MKNDPWRIVLNSSPSNGKTFEGEIISSNPQNNSYGDIHFYNYDLNLWEPYIYEAARFVSEYGFQSMPSLRSWKDVQKDTDDLGDLINHRQHHPLGNKPVNLLIEKNLPTFDENDHATFIYFSQISQAMAIKMQTNVYLVERGRPYSMYTMGALYWQLNDVWTAPSWSSIEFSGRRKVGYIKTLNKKDRPLPERILLLAEGIWLQ